MDKRSLQAEEAKFLRIRVEIPIDKPFRRGGNITNAEGERVWINFKYERLPTFCYICGILGHDDKHCHMSQSGGGGVRKRSNIENGSKQVVWSGVEARKETQ